MVEKNYFYLDRIPEGSRLEQICNELKQFKISDIDNVETFLFKLFINCHKFIFENIKPIFNPSITPHLIYQTEEYNKIEREKEKTSINPEPSKVQTSAFHVGNEFRGDVFVNAELLFSLLQYGYPTFALNFVIIFFVGY